MPGVFDAINMGEESGVASQAGHFCQVLEWTGGVSDLCTIPLPSQEMALSGLELPGTVESVEEALKQHRDFLTTMELNQQKMHVAVQAAESLLRQGNIYGEQAQEAVTRLLEK